jgi:hypothetical protein
MDAFTPPKQIELHGALRTVCLDCQWEVMLRYIGQTVNVRYLCNAHTIIYHIDLAVAMRAYQDLHFRHENL